MARVGSTRITNVLLGALIITMIATQGLKAGANLPADKVVASGSKIAVAGPNERVKLLSATLRSSTTSDLLLSLTLECSILTHLVTGPSDNGGTDSALASGTVRAWIEIDGQVVPINSTSAPPQNPPAPGGEPDKVTFCNRAYSRTVMDAENPADGQDIEDDYIDTKAAHAFNWVRLNLGNGIHTIEAWATLEQETQGDATATVVIGNRVLIAEPQHMANNASI
jgi:hypothetical protein